MTNAFVMLWNFKYRFMKLLKRNIFRKFLLLRADIFVAEQRQAKTQMWFCPLFVIHLKAGLLSEGVILSRDELITTLKEKYKSFIFSFFSIIIWASEWRRWHLVHFQMRGTVQVCSVLCMLSVYSHDTRLSVLTLIITGFGKVWPGPCWSFLQVFLASK